MEPQQGRESGAQQQRTEATARGADREGRPYAFYLVALAIVTISVTFVATMAIFATSLQQAAEVTTSLTSLFTVIGTVVGAYFGIKVSSDTIGRIPIAGEAQEQRPQLQGPQQQRPYQQRRLRTRLVRRRLEQSGWSWHGPKEK